jgi:hypothetical protein
MNLLARIAKQLDAGWFSRILIGAQIWLAWDLLVWSQAFASTALAAGKDLTGAAGVIAATAAAPLGLVTLAINSYMQTRATRPVVIADRREHGNGNS